MVSGTVDVHRLVGRAVPDNRRCAEVDGCRAEDQGDKVLGRAGYDEERENDGDRQAEEAVDLADVLGHGANSSLGGAATGVNPAPGSVMAPA